MMKNRRHKIISEIISQKSIETQTDLLDELNKLGLEVTQGTLSRDIREMGIIKTTIDNGKSRYVLPSQVRTGKAKYDSIIKHSVIDVDHAMNIVVVKTYSGMANAAAAAFDNIGFSDCLGSIAGDDTIMFIVRDEKAAESFCAKVEKIIF